MTQKNPTPERMKEILSKAKTIAVVGLSNNPARVSYQVSERMKSYGYKIIPVNPMIEEALGETAVASLTEIKERVDIINVFRRVDQILPVAREAVEFGKASVFWTQLGLADEEAAALCEQHGMTVVMDKCIKVAYAELFK